VSPIFVRPVREQLEHDRLIRFLQTKYKRKGELAINVGDEQVAPVKLGANTFFPDLVLSDGNKPVGIVEVESVESVNHLEAMAQWVHFAKARVPFHLYVPVQAFDVARRLCAAHHARVTELWTYRATHDGFDLVRMAQDTAAPGGTVDAAKKAGRAAAAKKKAAVKKTAKKAAAKPAAKKPAAKAARKSAARAPTRKAAAKPKKAARKK
jgi:hypothetical protein